MTSGSRSSVSALLTDETQFPLWSNKNTIWQWHRELEEVETGPAVWGGGSESVNVGVVVSECPGFCRRGSVYLQFLFPAKSSSSERAGSICLHRRKTKRATMIHVKLIHNIPTIIEPVIIQLSEVESFHLENHAWMIAHQHPSLSSLIKVMPGGHQESHPQILYIH